MNLTLTPVRFLERTAKLFGGKTGVICNEQRFTYRQFSERANRLSDALLALGVEKGDRVSYLGYNCHRLLEAYFGIPQIGAILMPLNIRLAAKDFAYILNESKPRVLFLDEDFIPQIEQIKADIDSVEHFVLLRHMARPPSWVGGFYDDLLNKASGQAPFQRGEYPFGEDDVAEIFYTSGTTGRPKGVMLTHRNLYLHAMATMSEDWMDETDIQIHLIPLFHVNGWGTPHYLTAKGGGHIMTQRFSPSETIKIIEREKVTRLYIIPLMVNAILAEPNLKQYDLSSLRSVLIGGAPPATGMIERCEEAFGCVVHTGFGMTEACPLIAWPALGPFLDPETRNYRARKTWGFMMQGVDFRVVDQDGRDLPWDSREVGELLVRGDMIMKGYYDSPQETAITLADGWYHTGDLVSLGPDGSLFIRDRKKDIIISGGENISSLEVEATLYAHRDIVECAVIGKKDQKWGETPVAIVVLREGSKLTPEGIIAFAKENLAKFKVPKEVFIIDEFPRGGTGKILKAELRDIYGSS